VRFQKLMWRNMMRSTKSQKVSILHYSIDMRIYETLTQTLKIIKKKKKITFVIQGGWDCNL
jgi:hypothetical protein